MEGFYYFITDDTSSVSKMLDLLDKMQDYTDINSICYRLKKTNYPMSHITEEEKNKMKTEALEGKKPCVICGKIGNFVNIIKHEFYPVIDHDHLCPTNNIIGISHNVCNINRNYGNYGCVKMEEETKNTEHKYDEYKEYGFSQEDLNTSPKKKKVNVVERLHIPVLFHNLNYDIQYVRQALAERGCSKIKKISLIAKSEINWMNFPYCSFVFIDSMRFCPAGKASLEKQINTITEDGKHPEKLVTLRKAIKKLYPNAEPDAWKLLAGKMPFDAYSQYNDKVANLPFPPREQCINSLTKEAQSVKDRALISSRVFQSLPPPPFICASPICDFSIRKIISLFL